MPDEPLISGDCSDRGLLPSRRFKLGGSLVSLVVSLAACTIVRTIPGGASPTPPPPPPAPGDPMALLGQLRIDDNENYPEYDRAAFEEDWVDLDGNGCTTREDVLIAESLTPVETGDGPCDVVSGTWYSIYDGETATKPSDVDIDHLIALAEAWRSGAHAWATDQRVAFANDIENPDVLIAVSDNSNSAKSDADPADWQPEVEQERCAYVVRWINVKLAYELSADSRERDAIGRTLEMC